MINNCTAGFIKSGKLNMIIDGQFGSTGKGLISAKIAVDNHIDVVCSRLSPNAGHTFYYQNKKYVSKLIPVAGVIQDRNVIYIGFGSVIDTEILFKEIEEFDIDPCRIKIHPRAAVITTENKILENNKDGIVKIASTQSGSGAARSSKIMRVNPLAQNTESLKQFVDPSFDLEFYLNYGLNVFVETGQGLDLSLNVGYSYPYCTSVDVIPSAILSDFGLHPKYMGNCMMSIRTYPIRVGNPKDDSGNDLGYSGPVYPDSNELTWDDLKQEQELTTVTKRVRRVFTFSKEQYIRSLKLIKPTHIFLNFINYIREEDLNLFRFTKIQKPNYVGYGPYTNQVIPYEPFILDNYLYSFK